MAGSDWYNEVITRIENAENTLTESEAKRYRTDFLKRLVQRVESFSSDCGECKNLQSTLSELSEKLANHSNLSDDEKKTYQRTVSDVTWHLQRQHRLFVEGQNMVIYMPIGVGFGVALGLVLGNIAIGIPIGAGLGMTLGIILDTKARKNGKVI